MRSSQLLQHLAAGSSSSSTGALQLQQRLAAAEMVCRQMTHRTAQPSSSSGCTHDLHRCRAACTQQQP